MSALTEARVVERTILERWTPIAGPIACLCGHEHYGRIMHSAQAAQWHICEDVECSCKSLRPALPASPAVGDAS